MLSTTRRRWTRLAASGILAGVAGCGGAAAAPPEVPGAPPDQDTKGAAVPASITAPAEKHACNAANGCKAGAMPAKGPDAPQPGAAKSP